MNIYITLYYLTGIAAAFSLFWVIFIVLSSMKLGSYLDKHDSNNAPKSRYSFMFASERSTYFLSWLSYLIPIIAFFPKTDKDRDLVKLVNRVRLYILLSIGSALLAILLRSFWIDKLIIQ